MIDCDVVFNTQKDYRNGAHAHLDDMLFVPIAGHYTVGDEKRLAPGNLSAGSIYLVPRRQIHSFQSEGHQEHLCYYLDASKIGGGRPDRSAIWQKSIYLSSLTLVRRQLFVRSRSRKTYETAAIDDLIVREVHRIFSDVAPTAAWSEAAMVEAVCDYIASNLGENLSMDVLAETFRVSPRTLARWFQLHKGASPGRHILLARLNRARELLHGTDIPVSQIQAATGFDSAAHFAYAFRREFGISPSDMRRGGALAQIR